MAYRDDSRKQEIQENKKFKFYAIWLHKQLIYNRINNNFKYLAQEIQSHLNFGMATNGAKGRSNCTLLGTPQR